MEILICRLKPWMAIEVAKNLSARGHSVHSIDHGQLNEYVSSGVFKTCHLWKWIDTPEKELEKQFRGIVLRLKVNLVIITQKLFLYSNVAEKICKELGIRAVFTEFFFDDKLIFDDVGLQYTKCNQSVGICDLPIDWPKQDREQQPADKSVVNLISQLNLSTDKIVVVYGQVLWDMSLIECPEGITYDEYIDGLCRNNLDTIFLFKPHPKDHYREPNSTKYSYPNMIRVDESLRTLFKFKAHTAYSSTVIFEGVSRGLRFASVGYHLLQNHTYKITRHGFGDIYNKILAYKPDQKTINKKVSYITNIYAMPMSDPTLADRLINGLHQGVREYVLAKETAR
jgi:hypothetical protein